LAIGRIDVVRITHPRVLRHFDSRRVAGGLLVTAMGWKLLSEGTGSSREPLHDAADAGAAHDGFYPLTLPLTVGPGAISVALTIGSHHPQDPFGANAMLLAAAALLGLLAIALAIYGSYALPCHWCAISGRPASTC
jgi:multiple antibiotic resistance protein